MVRDLSVQALVVVVVVVRPLHKIKAWLLIPLSTILQQPLEIKVGEILVDGSSSTLVRDLRWEEEKEEEDSPLVEEEVEFLLEVSAVVMVTVWVHRNLGSLMELTSLGRCGNGIS